MHIHILGICGTFMGGVAALAQAAGHRVTGSDRKAYPPMSTQLENLGIEVRAGFDPAHLDPAPDMVVVGNVMSRGNPAVEAMLNRGLAYVSGPQWLADHVLAGQWVLAVAGTHGKTTTASMLAWILEYAGMQPGFLIGGVPDNFGLSARYGGGSFFVVEADEYDTAFFDKRSKFVHYRPRTLILNNLEYDHADIFPDLAAIERQFHHLVRTVPGDGKILRNAVSDALDAVIDMGCWTPMETFSSQASAGADWSARAGKDGRFEAFVGGTSAGTSRVGLPGVHNMENALAACAAARHAGVPVGVSLAALREFAGVKRRMQIRHNADGVTVYDDFAHHPTAIAASIGALRQSIGNERLLVVVEPGSNTMKLGVHRDSLGASLDGADAAFLFQPDGLRWDLAHVAATSQVPVQLSADIDGLVQTVSAAASATADTATHVLVMSNGGFGGMIDKLIERLGPAGDGRRHAG